jgi:hypothetical protein
LTASQLLQRLRQRGYSVFVDDCQLVVRGRVPPDEQAALRHLAANRDDLVLLLETEQHPTVAAALDVLGAELREVLPAEHRTRDPVGDREKRAKSVTSTPRLGETAGPGPRSKERT